MLLLVEKTTWTRKQARLRGIVAPDTRRIFDPFRGCLALTIPSVMV
jgi:hypothetical protein